MRKVLTLETTAKNVSSCSLADNKGIIKMYKYDLGIIGGMGSEATVEVYKRIVNRTKHSCDQEHMRICILNNSIILLVIDNPNPLPLFL